jgi:hypothetical protein
MPNRRFLICLLALVPFAGLAQSASDVDRSAGNLMLVLRESLGGPVRKSEILEHVGKRKARLKSGEEVEIEVAHYAYLGDMHIRFVFDGPTLMLNATPKDLENLHLGKPEDALRVAIANLRRVYGAPKVTALAGGILQVESGSPDLNSSYFLDKAFWTELNRKSPEGIVAGVPKRGALVFAPLSDWRSVDALRASIAQLHASSESQRVSSALYLFKDGNWTLFQEPGKQ